MVAGADRGGDRAAGALAEGRALAGDLGRPRPRRRVRAADLAGAAAGARPTARKLAGDQLARGRAGRREAVAGDADDRLSDRGEPVRRGGGRRPARRPAAHRDPAGLDRGRHRSGRRDPLAGIPDAAR